MGREVLRSSSARERILDTASTLFYAEGIHAVGVDRVALEANVAKATLYQQFGSKEELVAACLRQRSADWRRHLADPVLSRPGSPSARVARVFDLLGRGFAAPEYRGCPFINAAAEYPGQDGPVAAAIQGHRGEVRQLFANLLGPVGPSARRSELIDQLLLIYDGTMISAELDWSARPQRTAKSAAMRLLELSATSS